MGLILKDTLPHKNRTWLHESFGAWKKELCRMLKSALRSFLSTFDHLDYYERRKVALLSALFGLLIAAYSILRPLKSSIFNCFVGVENLQYAKILMFIVIIPCMFLYSILVDRLRRHQLTIFFLIVYAVLCIIFAYYLLHPTIGIQNTSKSVTRLFGWFFYIAMDLYPTLVVGTFWAFTNSISTPNTAKTNYAILTAVSRGAGCIASALSWVVMQCNFSHASSHAFFVSIIACFLLIAAALIEYLHRSTPSSHIHGYTDTHLAGSKKEKTNMFEGLKLLIAQPYVFGIFWIVYSFEFLTYVLDFQQQYLISLETNNAVGGTSSYLFGFTALFQLIGLVLALLGAPLLNILGVARCVVIVPAVTVLLMVGLAFFQSLTAFSIALIALRALYYGFNIPVVEMLYIPTVKDIQFKAKGWVESSGRTISKIAGTGAIFIAQAAPVYAYSISSVLSIASAVSWTCAAYLVGRKYHYTVTHDKVIGVKEENLQS